MNWRLKLHKAKSILLTACIVGFLVNSGLFFHAWLSGGETAIVALGAIGGAFPLILEWFLETLLPSLTKPNDDAPTEYTITFERTVTRKVERKEGV